MTEANINTQIVCRVCRESKQLDMFPKMPTGKHGRTTRCKPCTAIYLKQYKEENKEKLKVHKQKYYLENKEVLNAIGKADYQKNKDAYKARAKKWAQQNPEARKEVRTRYSRANPEKMAEKNRKHRTENRGMYQAYDRARQTREMNAMPVWANEAAIKEIYDECSRISKETGIKHHVDHFYPLKNDLVCGLHVEFNLRVIPAVQNLSKGNSFPNEE